MESEFERILRNQQPVRDASPGVFLIVAVPMFLLGLVPMCLRVAGLSASGGEFCLVITAFCLIAYYRAKQSKVNLALVKAIEEIRERLDQGAGKENV